MEVRGSGESAITFLSIAKGGIYKSNSLLSQLSNPLLFLDRRLCLHRFPLGFCISFYSLQTFCLNCAAVCLLFCLYFCTISSLLVALDMAMNNTYGQRS